MLLHRLVTASESVAATRSRKKKTAILAEALREAGPAVGLAASYLAGELPQGRIGIGYALSSELQRSTEPSTEPSLQLDDIHRCLEEIRVQSGAGSQKRRRELLGGLFSRATALEQRFLSSLLVGNVRQGALESLILEAIAAAFSADPAVVRRAQMLEANLSLIARTARDDGGAGLAQFDLEPLKPFQPMLAQTAETTGEVFASLDTAALELKLDGARVQAHKRGSDVRIFSRALNDVTPAVPELSDLLRALPHDELILDGEIIALKPDGSPHPFQTTMRRFGRKKGPAALEAELPLSPFFFDLVYLDGRSLLDAPARERYQAMAATLPTTNQIERLITSDAGEAQRFLSSALARGHEGVMAKSLDAIYEAGSRGASWLKIKHAHTLDLVVIAVEWGSGRRKGWLSNLHLACRDDESGQFIMLGKTFKGMTDKMLAFQTEHLLRLETHRDNHVVFVKPELVVEIAFSDLQTSPHYPAGLALRFARVKRYRQDKTAEQADTLATVRSIALGTLTR